MEVATVEMIDAAAGSESYINNNIIKETVASSSNNQEQNFELLDSVYSAAADGDIDKFQRQAAVRLDQILTPYGNTILHIHIIARPPSISNLLEKGDFVSEILGMCPDLLWKDNKKGETLLHMAARHGHADVAKYLLQECKNTPYQNHHHDQELGIIITSTRLMLQMINEAKDTALHEAVRYNHLDVVKVLTEEDGELPYEANNAGETPLYLAAERGYAEILKKILSTCHSPADHGPYSRTALHAAVICNNTRTTRLLLEDRRIQKSEQDQQGWTPLHFAAHLRRIRTLKRLLIIDKSAAYKADNKGKTALHIAAGHGKVQTMQELISSCPSCCELIDKRGWNVLHFACKSNKKKAIKLVLRNPSLGNLINEKDENGDTPFLLSVSKRCIINHPKVDKLVFNNHNHNAVDITLANFSPWNPKEFMSWKWIRDKIKRSRRIMPKDDDDEGNKNKVSSNSNDGKRKDKSGDNFVEEVKQNELVAATLIATVTFAAGFTVPGGFIADKGPDQGTAILSRYSAFRAFAILNTISMFLSSLAVFNRLSGYTITQATKVYRRRKLGRLFIFYAMMAMIGAFLSGTYAVLHSDKYLATSTCVIPVGMFVLLYFGSRLEFPLSVLLKTYQILYILVKKRTKKEQKLDDLIM